MSIAVLTRVVRICAGVSRGFADLTRAAIAPACGAAADVPKNGFEKPPTPVTATPSAAVTSGLFNTCPPVDEKLPPVIALPSALKKIRRGPSELNVSTELAALKGNGYGPAGQDPQNLVNAGVAATPNEFAADRGGVTVSLAGRGNRQPAAIGVQMQESAGCTGLLHDHDSVADIGAGDLFVRILNSVLEVRRAGEDTGAGAVQSKQVVVVARPAKRIRPMQVDQRRSRTSSNRKSCPPKLWIWPDGSGAVVVRRQRSRLPRCRMCCRSCCPNCRLTRNTARRRR